MNFKDFFQKCQNESTVSDFESYIAFCILDRKGVGACSVEEYSRLRDRAFERRDEKAAKSLYDSAAASQWKEGEWEGALK